MKPELLPVFGNTVTLNDAIKRLKQGDLRNVRGVIAVNGETATVASLENLLYSLRQDGGDLPLTKALDRSAFHSQKVALHELESSDIPDTKWVTNIRLLDFLRSSASVCICNENPSHVFTKSELITPGKCNLDGSDMTCM